MHRLKNIALFLIVCFYTVIGISQTSEQKMDSLKLNLKSEKNIDSIIEINYEIAELQMSSQSIDEASKTLHNLLKYSVKNKREIGIGKASLLLARIFDAYKHQTDSALYYVNDAIRILKKENANLELIHAYLVKTHIYESQSDYENQLRNGLLALEVAKKTKDNVQISQCYIILGSYFYTQEKYEEALRNSKYGLKYGLLSKDKDRIINSQFLLAETYKAMADTANANTYFEKTYKLAKANNNKYILVALLPDWADISDKRSALQMRLEVEEIMNNSGGGSQQTHNKGLLGVLYFNMFKSENNPIQKKEFFAKAEGYLTESIKNADDQEDLAYSISLNKTLSELYFIKNDYKNAYKYVIKSTLLNDSLNSQQIKNKLAKIESQKEIDVRDKEIEVNNLKLDTQRKQQYYLIAGLVLLFVIGGLLFYQSRTRRKTNTVLLTLNQELDESNKIKARFVGILNHDLRVPVANLIQFLHLKKDVPEAVSDEINEKYEEKTIAAAENLLISMEDMLLWSKSQMDNFQPSFKNVSVASIFSDIGNHFSDVEKVSISFENPKDILLHTDADYLKTIMRNLTANAIKALEKTKNATIIWTIKEEKGNILLAITDNGPGGATEKFSALYDETEMGSIKTGLGLHLIRDLAKAIHCEILLLSKVEKGTRITLQFHAIT